MAHAAIRPEDLAAECAAVVRDAARAARAETGSLKAALADVARRFGISPRRAAAYWWGEVRRVPAEELLRLRAAREDELRREAERLRARLAQVHALLGVGDTDAPVETRGPDGGGPGRPAAGRLADRPRRGPVQPPLMLGWGRRSHG